MARDRIEWERDVIYHMECIMELTTSDSGFRARNHRLGCLRRSRRIQIGIRWHM
jgi:hypothetical protein